MRVKTLLFVVVVVSILTISCSKKVYFNDQMRETLEVANIPLTGLQFYNDKKIVLKRKLKSETTKVESGTVQLKDGKYIHFLILQKKTPGVCKNITNDELSIAFENGDGKLLKFKNFKKKDLKAGYQLMLNTETANNTVSPKIVYDGKEYFIHSKGQDVKLLIKREDLSEVKVKKKRMKGVRIK